MRNLAMAALMLACLAAPAGAQPSPEAAQEMEARLNAPSDPALAPVETLSCDEMMGEMTIAGQQMHAQMDPNLGANAQEMLDRQQRGMRDAQAGIMAGGLMCAIPGLGMACGAIMQAQMANQMAHAEEHQQDQEALIGSMNEATAGIDLARMQALSERFESENCPTPE